MTPIESAIDAYLLNTGYYPTALNDLIIDPGIPGWAGPYLKQSQVFDTWNRPLIYLVTGESYSLISLGADGLPGGQDDNADVYNK
jgi:general secretion pathway protein G